MDKTEEVPDEDRYLVPGLLRGLDVLQLFTPERTRFSLGELAALLGITRSALFRVTYTLARSGFLVHHAADQTFSLGPAVLRLGHGYPVSRRLVEAALPVLEALRDGLDWSTHLGVLERRDVVYLLRVPTRRGLRSIVQVGTRLPAHATSMGRVLLAGLSAEEVAGLYRDVALVGAGPRTPTSLAGLLKRHREDRDRAFVLQDGGFEAGITSVAAPLRDDAGRTVAAINATTAVRAGDGAGALDGTVRQVRAAAERLSRSLGGRG